MRHRILAFIAVSMLLLAGCASQPPPVVVGEPNQTAQAQPPAQNVTAAKPCSAGNIVQNDNCFASLAAEKEDPSYCGNIYSISILDSCLAHFANGSLEICKQVSTPSIRFSCLTANAVREKSEATCNMIDNTEAAADCLRKVLPPCMLISDEGQRSLCMALDKKDFSLCKGDACLVEYAINQSDELACGAITQQNDRYYCLAMVAKSAAVCLNAPLQPVQDLCIERVAEALGDVSTCGLATAGSDYRNACYLYFAVQGLDPSICEQPLWETQRDACYKNYSLQTATVNACPKIMESTNRVDCYFKAAKINRMPSLCNLLWTNDYKNTCYSGAILYPQNGPVASDCPSVTDYIWRDKCYYQAARMEYNGSLCSFITQGSSDRKNCDSLFSQ